MARAKEGNDKMDGSSTVRVVFISLLLDLLAFTMILPLFPSLLDHYKEHDKWGVYSWISKQIFVVQEMIGAPDSYNSVLFGGFLGSMYSFLQFIASPICGALSDRFGRKPVMMTCLVSFIERRSFKELFKLLLMLLNLSYQL